MKQGEQSRNATHPETHMNQRDLNGKRVSSCFTLFRCSLQDMQVVSELCDRHNLSLPIAGAIKELVKDARKTKATNPPDWTGEGGVPTRL